MNRVATIGVLAFLVGCSHLAIRHKGPPREVRVTRQVSAPQTGITAVRRGPSSVELVAYGFADVSTTRHVKYAIGEVRLVSGRNPVIEIFEVVAGFMQLAAMPVMNVPSLPSDSDQEVRWSQGQQIRTLLDPTRTLIGAKLELHIPDEVGFESAPRTRRYRVQLPLASRALRFRAFDVAQQLVLEGSVQTDAFGIAVVDNLNENVVALVVSEGTDTSERWVAIETPADTATSMQRWEKARQARTARDAARAAAVSRDIDSVGSPLVAPSTEPPPRLGVHDYRGPSWRTGIEVTATMAAFPLVARSVSKTTDFDLDQSSFGPGLVVSVDTWPIFSRRFGLGVRGIAGAMSARVFLEPTNATEAVWADAAAMVRLGLHRRVALTAELGAGARALRFEHEPAYDLDATTIGQQRHTFRRASGGLELCVDGLIAGLRIFGYGGYCGTRVDLAVAYETLEGRMSGRIYELGLSGHWLGRVQLGLDYPVAGEARVGEDVAERATKFMFMVGRRGDWFGDAYW